MKPNPAPRSRTTAVPRPTKSAAPVVGYSGKPTIDKLGVKPGMRVAVLGLGGERAFLKELAARTSQASIGRAIPGAELVLVRMEAEKDLLRLPAIEKSIRRDGAIWVVWPKGRPAFKEDHVRAAALAQGLVDVKVCAFSETLSALKLVVPVARR